MTSRTTATLAALALSTAMATSALAVPQFRLDLIDFGPAPNPASSITYYNVGTGSASTGAISFDGYTFNVSLNTNFPGTPVLGTLSQSFTFSGSLPGANRNFYSTITVVDSGSQNTQAIFTQPILTGGGYQLVSDSANTSNASISGGFSQTSSRGNATSVINAPNQFTGSGGSSPSATALIPADPAGYTLTNSIFFNNIVANGEAGLSSITASASSSVQAVPAPSNVPEPASLALLGAGLFGAGMLRRRAK